MGLGLLRGQPQPPGRAVAEQAVAARGDAELHLLVADEFRFMGPLAIVECAHLILFWWRPLLSGPPFAARWRLAAAKAACAADPFPLRFSGVRFRCTGWGRPQPATVTALPGYGTEE